MKKVILLALLGLSVSSFGQEFKKKDRIDSFFDARRKERVDKIFGVNKLTKSSIYKTPSSFYMKRYSNQLIAREVMTISGVVLNAIGINMITNSRGNNSSSTSQMNQGNTFCIIGSSCLVSGYVIHLSSLGTLRKYALRSQIK